MSVAVAQPPAAPAAPVLPQSERVDFDYRPVPVSAPVAAVLGVLGLTGFLAAAGLVLAAAGVVTALVAWRAVRRTDGGGLTLALGGLALSLVGLIGGAAAHYHAYQTEVPEGFTRLDFTADISEKAAAAGLAAEAANPAAAVAPAVADLDGEQIFLKGYMYPDPSGRERDLGKFIFVKDSGECCFGGSPAVTDMILVTMDDSTADFYGGLVSVAGTFKLRPVGGRGELNPLFELTATQAGPAKTSF